MALSTFLDAVMYDGEHVRCEPSLDSSVLIGPERIKPREKSLDIDTPIDPANWLVSRDRELRIENCLDKIKPAGFPIERPWLPQQALRILNKLRKGPIAEKELITLMELVASQATAHFQLEEGRFVALTVLGQIVEVSDTRVGLLKKIQGRKFPEQIFVWRVGFDSFSGRT